MYDRDALLAAIDLRDLADELLGPGRSTGRSRMWPCPSAQHAQTGRTPPVSVFTSRRGEQRWRCHGCGEGGTAIDLVLACRGGEPLDAMTYLAERAGQHEQPQTWRPSPRPASDRTFPAAGCANPEGIHRYVRECAARLWTNEGRHIRQWLTQDRGLPEDVLRQNAVGADLGPQVQWRPDGMPRASGAVLPAVVDDRAVYAQLRVPHPRRDAPRYLNPSGALAPNPRLVRIHPVEIRHPEVIVTEGAIDALSAAAAGFRAVGVLSAAYGDASVAAELARLPAPLVLAFDADDAGRLAASHLAGLLRAAERQPMVLDLGDGDLNEASLREGDWPSAFRCTLTAGLRLDATGRSVEQERGLHAS